MSEVVVRSFERELSEMRAALYAHAVALTHDPAAAEDLVQETLMRALHARCRFQKGTDLGAWTHSIMRNAFIDARRRKAVRARWELVPPFTDDDRTFGPLDVLGERDVAEVLPFLPPRDREIFELAYFDNLSYRDIADRLKLPMNTAGTRLLRAKLRVRKLLKDVFEQRYGRRSPLGAERTGRPSTTRTSVRAVGDRESLRPIPERRPR